MRNKLKQKKSQEKSRVASQATLCCRSFSSTLVPLFLLSSSCALRSHRSSPKNFHVNCSRYALLNSPWTTPFLWLSSDPRVVHMRHSLMCQSWERELEQTQYLNVYLHAVVSTCSLLILNLDILSDVHHLSCCSLLILTYRYVLSANMGFTLQGRKF
jgi:hypothetical protein